MKSLDIREYKQRVDRASDLLNFEYMKDEQTMFNKDGSYLAFIKYRGPDLDSTTDEELLSLTERVNRILMRLGDGWCVLSEANRTADDEYPESKFDNKLAEMIDETRGHMFKSNHFYKSDNYISLQYYPQRNYETKLNQFFGKKETNVDAQEKLIQKKFSYEVGRIVDSLESILPEVEVLKGDAITTYLGKLLGADYDIKVPKVAMFISEHLTSKRLVPGKPPKLGEKYLGVVTIKGYPQETLPGILDELNRLGISYRWVTRYIFLDKERAERIIENYKGYWTGSKKSLLNRLWEKILKTSEDDTNLNAEDKSLEAGEALRVVQAQETGFGYLTTSIVVADEDKKILERKLKQIEKVVNNAGYVAFSEQEYATIAWLGTIPGNTRFNLRRHIVNIKNLVHMMPISAVWGGQQWNKHLDDYPLFYGLTDGTTRFKFVNHIKQVGHTFIVGPTGAGKSVMMGMFAASFKRYKDSRVTIFDTGRSLKILTKGMGGVHHDIGAETSSYKLQPLRNIDNSIELRFAYGWLLHLLLQEEVKITSEKKTRVLDALKVLQEVNKNHRTLTNFVALVQDREVQQALAMYTVEGPYGQLLDASDENEDKSMWQCFEMESLINNEQIAKPVLNYLFHKLSRSFDGKPNLILIEEAWKVFDHPVFENVIRDWLKTLRKKNVSVVFTTQSLSDAEKSNISDTIAEQCSNHIYLPNETALQENTYKYYEKRGLNHQQINIIATAIKARDYYYTSTLGNRLFELQLDELALAYLGADSKEDLALADKISSRTTTTEEFNREYLASKNLTWVADKMYGEKIWKKVA